MVTTTVDEELIGGSVSVVPAAGGGDGTSMCAWVEAKARLAFGMLIRPLLLSVAAPVPSVDAPSTLKLGVLIVRRIAILMSPGLAMTAPALGTTSCAATAIASATRA